MNTVSYSVKEIKELIKESKSEFNAKLGPSVRKDNKSNNEKFYKGADGDTKDYDGGLGLKMEKDNNPLHPDENRNMLHLNPRLQPDKDYSDRVDAQAKGFTSKMEMENGSPKNGNFKGNEKFLNGTKKNRDDRENVEKKFAKTGLQARELDDKSFNKNHLSEGKKVTKRITFKKPFINESNMLQRIPEEYITDGAVICMSDRSGNEYIVECVENKFNGFMETNVLGHNNKKQLNEQLDRMYSLFDYEDGASRGNISNKEKIEETATFGELMNMVRGK